jgi:hypothetical protein
MTVIQLPAMGQWYLNSTASNADLNSGAYTIQWDQEKFKTFSGTPMNTSSSGVFTAPSAGKYEITCQVSLKDDTDDAATYYQLIIKHTPSGGAAADVANCRRSTKGGDEENEVLFLNFVIDLGANDTIYTYLFQSGGTDQTDVFGGATVTFITIKKLLTYA